jgi:hypothetical protein
MLRQDKPVEFLWQRGGYADGVGCAARRGDPAQGREGQTFLQDESGRDGRLPPEDPRRLFPGGRHGEPPTDWPARLCAVSVGRGCS